jgi:hypothetical protein
MIKAVMFQSSCEVTVDDPNFYEELARFKSEIPHANRAWSSCKKVWVVTNPELFKELSYINTALEERKLQPELF